jgi:hypothetical protein
MSASGGGHSAELRGINPPATGLATALGVLLAVSSANQYRRYRQHAAMLVLRMPPD